jgi:integrase
LPRWRQNFPQSGGNTMFFWSMVMAYSKCGAFTVGKGWRRTIGKKVGDGGRLLPCRFWLGMDKQKATATALAIESLWVSHNAPYWSGEAFKLADAIRIGATATIAPASEPSAIAVKPTAVEVLTFKGLIERFRTAYLADVRLSEPSKHSMVCRTKTLERSLIASMPLETIGAEQLASVVSYWLAHPIAPRKGKPISDYSARMIVKTARAVFDYADAVGVWEAPRRFDRIFRLPRTTTAPIINTYSVAELARLYKQANGRMKLLILLALNCGFCSAELATLKRSEIDLKNKVIKRARQKNGNFMSWSLWDETVKMLKKSMATDGELALRRENGSPLVSFDDVHRRLDGISYAWRNLLEQANRCENGIVGSFKTLRKTGATMIRAIGGIEVSEMYLSHSEKSMAKFYSTPNMEQLSTALVILRKQLAPMFR